MVLLMSILFCKLIQFNILLQVFPFLWKSGWDSSKDTGSGTEDKYVQQIQPCHPPSHPIPFLCFEFLGDFPFLRRGVKGIFFNFKFLNFYFFL